MAVTVRMSNKYCLSDRCMAALDSPQRPSQNMYDRSINKLFVLTPSDFHFLNQNVLAGAILFFWNQYSNIVRTKLSSTALTVSRVIIKK